MERGREGGSCIVLVALGAARREGCVGEEGNGEPEELAGLCLECRTVGTGEHQGQGGLGASQSWNVSHAAFPCVQCL